MLHGLLFLIAPLVFAPSVQDGDLTDLDRDATAAYRSGDYDTADALWIAALKEVEASAERGRLLYNLGNSAYRRGATLEAVGWYSAARRHAQRDADLWANLELARAEAGLEPADRGDLAATLGRLLSNLTRAEAEWFLLAALLVWGGCLAGEALRGGRSWRRAAWAGIVLVGVSALPLVWQVAGTEDAMLVVAEKGAAGRSEPRPDAKTLTHLEPGVEVRRLDSLPGWVRIEDGERRELWVQERTVFALSR